jgi:hypothetical protein
VNIKKIIREEIEDFTWITDAPVNPWLEYDAIIFDKNPKKEKVNNYIQLALNTKNPSNKGSWETRRKEDIESILRYIENYGETALMVDGNNNLVYADPSYYDGKTINSVRYSQLVNKNLNESEEEMEDPFKWIQEVEPPYVGMKFYFEIHPKIVYTIRDMNETHMYLDWIDPKDYKSMENFRWPIKHYLDFAIHGNIEVVNDTITESEEDEWDWARNSFISSNEIKVGNKIRIHNLGDKESFLSWLGDYRDRFLDKKYGDQIEGVVHHISGYDFSLDTKDDTIYFPSDENMLDLNSRGDYKNLYIGYELI